MAAAKFVICQADKPYEGGNGLSVGGIKAKRYDTITEASEVVQRWKRMYNLKLRMHVYKPVETGTSS